MKARKILENSTLILVILIPIFSTIFFHNHLTTLIEVLSIFIIFITTLVLYKDSRKYLKWYLLYILLCLIYLAINYYRSFNFYSLVPNNFNYSIIEECLTVIKLIIPVTFLYSLYYQKISKEKYLLAIKVICLLICLSIIITNIFKISLSSYSDLNITKNIFEWNNLNYYQDVASRAYFTYPNQIAVILVSLLIYFTYELMNFKKENIVYIIIISITSLMLGTRVSSLGALLVLITLLAVYIFTNKLKKEKLNKNIYYIIPIISMWILILPISPYMGRNSELDEAKGKITTSNNIIEEIPNKDALIENVNSEDNLSNYVYNNYNPAYLPKIFFEDYYPIKYDEKFWYNYIKETPLSKMNYRNTEKSIIKRVVSLNKKSGDIYFGIGNSRIQNIVNIESDIVLHFYAYGIIGSIILLAVYIMLEIYGLYKVYKEKNYQSFIILTLISLFIFISFLTGNILNSINATIPFIFIISSFKNKEINN